MSEREVDFMARNYGDWWTLQVLCCDPPRNYAIRKADGAIKELPDDDAPFVATDWAKHFGPASRPDPAPGESGDVIRDPVLPEDFGLSGDALRAARDYGWLLEKQILKRLNPAPAGSALEQLSESDKDVALGQAVEFAQYVSNHARGEMVKAAERFLALSYSQEIAERLRPAFIVDAGTINPQPGAVALLSQKAIGLSNGCDTWQPGAVVGDAAAVLEIVARYVGKTSGAYKYIRDDLRTLTNTDKGVGDGR